MVEVIPADEAAIHPTPVGSHVRLTGAYVLDQHHDWMEMHPVWVWEDLTHGAVMKAPEPTACQQAHPKDMGACGGKVQAPPTTDTGGEPDDGG